MSLMAKLKKNSKVVGTAILEDSEFFQEKEITRIDVPMMNVALSGTLDGGLASGLTVLAGPSKHFKTSFALIMASAYLKKYPESVVLFYDSEFGSPQSYFEQYDIDPACVLHTPITNVEELKFDLVNQLEGLERDDRVCIVIDSIGNLASKKELEDAINEKSVADMSRAKSLKGLFRMCTPYLAMKNIPMIAVNHTYKEIGLFPRDIVGGGTGLYYSADNIWIIGRQQEKKGTEIEGYHFVINVEKSRYVKEKSKIPITVTWDGGLLSHSGLLDVAIAGGYIKSPSSGWYSIVDRNSGDLLPSKCRAKDTLHPEFWVQILQETDFKQFIKQKFSIGGSLSNVIGGGSET